MALDPVSGIALFTDGSAQWKNRSGGWGWVAVDAFDGIHTASGHRQDTTISQMELEAPVQGLEWLHQKYGPCDVLVYSDSQYVVLGEQERSRKRNKNKAFWVRLDKAIAKHNYVEFIHVKGHANHLFNEMADELAGAARLKGLKP